MEFAVTASPNLFSRLAHVHKLHSKLARSRSPTFTRFKAPFPFSSPLDTIDPEDKRGVLLQSTSQPYIQPCP